MKPIALTKLFGVCDDHYDETTRKFVNTRRFLPFLVVLLAKTLCLLYRRLGADEGIVQYAILLVNTLGPPCSYSDRFYHGVPASLLFTWSDGN